MSKNGNNPQTQKVIMIGSSLLICIVLLICSIGFVIVYRDNIPVVKNYFPTIAPTQTLTPTPIPTPHILAHVPANNLLLFKDDFTTNHNEWSTYYSLEKVEVKTGKLNLESFDSRLGIAHCYCKSPGDQPFADTYYFQADVTTEYLTFNNYGLVFSLAENGDFYEFSINPPKKKYYLQKLVGSNWVDLFAGASKVINDYPDANTLSVYFDHGTIELFINGEKVTTYVDKKPINKGELGFITDTGDFKLIIDNLFAYNKK